MYLFAKNLYNIFNPIFGDIEYYFQPFIIISTIFKFTIMRDSIVILTPPPPHI